MMGPFLIAIAVFLFYVGFREKSPDFIKAMFPDIYTAAAQEEQNIDTAITNWAKTNIWDKLTNAIGQALPFGLGGSSGGSGGTSNSTSVPGVTGSGGGGGNNLVGHYTVQLVGGGSMTVNANSPQDAVTNVLAQGGQPAY